MASVPTEKSRKAENGEGSSGQPYFSVFKYTSIPGWGDGWGTTTKRGPEMAALACPWVEPHKTSVRSFPKVGAKPKRILP